MWGWLGGEEGRAEAMGLPVPNPISRYYSHFAFLATAGPWKVFQARHKPSEALHSVFFLDKRHSVKLPSKLARGGRRSLVELLRYEVRLLGSLRHPRLLRPVHDLEETADSLAFSAQRLRGTLASVYESSSHLGLEAEIKVGTLQLAEVLAFLNSGPRLVHGNLCPESVFVDENHGWLLGGLAFCRELGEQGPQWTGGQDPILQPRLDFLAPEALDSRSSAGPAADVFSLALLLLFLLSGESLIQAEGRVEKYRAQLESLPKRLAEIRPRLETCLREALGSVLTGQPCQRPSPQLFAMVKFFDEPGVAALRQLHDLSQLETPQRTHFLSHTLPDTLQRIPVASWERSVVGLLQLEAEGREDARVAVARPLLLLLARAPDQLLPALRPILSDILLQTDIAEASLTTAVLSNIPVIVSRLPSARVKERVLELALGCIAESSGAGSEARTLSLTALERIADELSGSFVKLRLVPALEELLRKGGPRLSSPEKLQLIACVSGLRELMELSQLLGLLTLLGAAGAEEGEEAAAVAGLVARLLAEAAKFRLRDAEVGRVLLPLLGPLLASTSATALQLLHVANVAHQCVDFVQAHRCAMLRSPTRSSPFPTSLPVVPPSPQVPELRVTGSFLVPDSSAASSRRGSFLGGALGSGLGSGLDAGGAQPRRSSHTPTLRPSASSAANPFLSTPDMSVRRHSYSNPAPAEPPKPTSLSNLSHNLACTLYNKFGGK